MSIKFKWVKTAEGHATGKVPLAMLEDTLTFSQPQFYRLQVGVTNEKGEIDWTDVEISTEPKIVTRYVAGRAVRGPE